MRVTLRDPTKGILDFSEALRHFVLHRYEPAADLRPWIEGYWVVEWDLPPGRAHRQTNLSHASVNVVLEPDPFLYGVPDRTFVRTIRGRGRVFGVKFRPGAFFPFAGRSLGPLAGRRVPATRLLGAEVTRWAANSAAAGDDGGRAALADAYWRSMRRASPARFTDGPPRATVIAEQIAADRTIVSVSQAAAAAGTDPRTLQRLFSREVGIRPKELIRRFRLQESAERLLRDPALSSGDLALELGYFDQAHFIHDFRAVVGTTPEEYRRRQRSPK